MGDLLDKETKQFLLVLAGIMIYLIFIYPRMMGGSVINPFSGSNSLLSTQARGAAYTPQIKSVDQSKNYFATISTSQGPIVIDLLEKGAPKNVTNFVNQVNSYKGAPIMVQKNFLLKVDAKTDIYTPVADEINADALGLGNSKVRDVRYFKDLYDPKDPSTRYFAPENLQRYEDFTVKEFYEEILDYKYKNDIDTPPARKYTVYMTSTGPNTNKTDFFILMTDAAANVNGRYTPIGQVTEGFEILDELNESKSGSVSVSNVAVNTY
jgi:cyclophilin family peptidyl-prolyl cis-trans isomerase